MEVLIVQALNQTTCYHESSEFQITQGGLHVILPNEKKRQFLPITGLEPTTSVITGQCLNHCAADANIYIA